MRSQAELDKIWGDIGKGAYGTDSLAPKRIVDDAVEQVMSIPLPDGGAEFYSRKPGGLWQPSKRVGQN